MQDLTNKTFKDRYSLTALLIIILAIGYLVLSEIPLNVFSYDILGYYLYLPASFKYKDLSLNNFDQLQNILSTYNTSEGFYQAFRVENGNFVMKYPMGMAIMYYPFYVIGDNLAHLLKYPEDGFSLPYQLSVLYGCYFYTVIGLIVFRKILLNFFTDKVAALTLLLIVFGTNYFLQVSIHAQPAMVHNLVFSLHAFTVYYTIKWHKTFKLKHIVIMSITVGLATLSRPSEVLIIFVPLLYNVFNIETLKHKVTLLYRYKNQIIAFICIVSVLVSYQLFYWKIITGSFLFDSYSDNLNEGFNFKHPYILEFLFSFRKGWLLYTPIMFFAILGFKFLLKASKDWFFSLIVYFVFSLYIMSSWSCWWYAVSFSSRAVIPAYVILSIPLGYFLNMVINSKLKFIIMPILIILVSLNLFQSWQMSHGILDGSRVTSAYYKSIFLQTTSVSDEQKKLLLIDKFSTTPIADYLKEHKTNFKLVYHVEENFDNKSKDQANIIDSISFSKKQSFLTDKYYSFAGDLRKEYKEITNKSYLILKITAKVLTRFNPNELQGRLSITMLHNGKGYAFRCADIRKLGLKMNEWNTVEFYYLTPDFWDKRDIIQGYFWNMSDKPIFVDNISIDAYEPIIDETVF